MREMRALASELAGRPDDMQLAMRLAARQLAMGVAEADPRFIGYAQATVARWWQDRSPPALLVFQARILQAQHRFVEAAADLHLALQDDANNLQALLVLASIDEVTGELDEARRSCEGFAQLRPGLAAAACIASVQSLTGHAASGYATLSNAVKQLPSPDRTERIWALAILAEIARGFITPFLLSTFRHRSPHEQGCGVGYRSALAAWTERPGRVWPLAGVRPAGRRPGPTPPSRSRRPLASWS